MTQSWADKAKILHLAMLDCDADEQLEFRLGSELWQIVNRIGLDNLWQMRRTDFAPGGKVQDLLKQASKQMEER
jgi:hypothetical protein